MPAVSRPLVSAGEAREPVPDLMAGDHLTRAEFERRYAAMPGVRKAELIEGVVYLPSPVSLAKHSRPHLRLAGWIATYEAATPGTEAGDNGTVRLDLDNEPQPDLFLRVLPESGGQSRTSADDYVEGAPELVAEIAATSASYDLHVKLHAYRRNGVKEYLVWRVLEGAVDWLALREGRYEPLPASGEGLVESQVFPGLRLDVAALLRGDSARVLDVVRGGIATEAHAAFVSRLAAR